MPLFGEEVKGKRKEILSTPGLKKSMNRDARLCMHVHKEILFPLIMILTVSY